MILALRIVAGVVVVIAFLLWCLWIWVTLAVQRDDQRRAQQEAVLAAHQAQRRQQLQWEEERLANDLATCKAELAYELAWQRLRSLQDGETR